VTTRLAFYLAPLDLRTPRTGEPIIVGETVTIDPPVKLCERGLHASEHVLDTLQYRDVGCLTLVGIGGEIVEGDDKIAGTSRKTLAILTEAQTERVLREIGCACAELAMQWAYYDRGEEPDPRSLEAIAVARRYARGEETREELDAARDAAWAVARAVARDAARDAAWAVARAAAWDAARDAAWAAAWTVARDAASDAAWDAARDAMHDIADRMALEAMGVTP
jgi:hypothetical protein